MNFKQTHSQLYLINKSEQESPEPKRRKIEGRYYTSVTDVLWSQFAQRLVQKACNEIQKDIFLTELHVERRATWCAFNALRKDCGLSIARIQKEQTNAIDNNFGVFLDRHTDQPVELLHKYADKNPHPKWPILNPEQRREKKEFREQVNQIRIAKRLKASVSPVLGPADLYKNLEQTPL